MAKSTTRHSENLIPKNGFMFVLGLQCSQTPDKLQKLRLIFTVFTFDFKKLSRTPYSLIG